MISVADILAKVQNTLLPATEKLQADSLISHAAVENVTTVTVAEQANIDSAVAQFDARTNAAKADASAAVSVTTADQQAQSDAIDEIEAMLQQLKTQSGE